MYYKIKKEVNMQVLQNIKQEISKVIIGHEHLIDSMLISLITGGHLLVEGVPGIAKTKSVLTLAKTIGLDFKRVQFTPDLLPSDITGIEIYNPKTNEFEIKKGPVFTNLLLADEINRAPAKVQSALLEVMQEMQVTIANETFKLTPPFLVIATQNPIEQEGTYPLPEAQLDRFIMKINVTYNTLEEEILIVKAQNSQEPEQVATIEDILNLQKQLNNIHMDEELLKYIAKITHATREPQKYGVETAEYIEYGASPRATIAMYNCSKAYAMIQNKDYVTPLDIIKVAKDVLRHRIILNYKAEIDEVTVDKVINDVIKAIDIP
ncbi:ATPase associated with various cellular activities, AAA_3 [Nautilia profundicola AmH]|uniref:ATPase associated with various cellular activities, AAA_3 n=2 Tax=Nautilia TaxID=191291 RepID=B9L899_NAUPA|nr:ATPase associated with various cellular activities, AAA_3 [Nautilia profundicola AmH]